MGVGGENIPVEMEGTRRRYGMWNSQMVDQEGDGIWCVKKKKRMRGEVEALTAGAGE